MAEKKILIACYFFPPYPGIGGRRTTKFARALADKGYEIHILGAKNPYEEESTWLKDSQHPNIFYHAIPSHYPKGLLPTSVHGGEVNSLWARGKYKLAMMYYSRIQKKRIYDPSFRMEKEFNKKLEELITTHHIQNIWVSVAPHYYANYAAKLKREKFPDLNYVIDFRDPWLTMRDFGMQEMGEAQLANEKKLIAETMEQVDALFSPSMYMLEEFKPFLNREIPIVEIPHPCDLKDIASHTEGVTYVPGEKIKFVYGGTLYTDLALVLKFLKKALDHLKEKNSPIYAKLDFLFYTNELSYASIFEDHQEIVTFHPQIGKQIFKEVFQADFVSIMYAEHNKHFRTTKFSAYLPSQRPYWYLGPVGDTYEFIEKHGLGVSLALKEDIGELVEFLEGADEYRKNFRPGLDYHEFTVENQVKRIEQLFVLPEDVRPKVGT